MGSTSLPSTLSPSNTACDSVPAWISPPFPSPSPTWLLCNKQGAAANLKSGLEIRGMLTGKKKDRQAPEASRENVKGLPSRMVPLGRDEGWSASSMRNIKWAWSFLVYNYWILAITVRTKEKGDWWVIFFSLFIGKIWLSIPNFRCKH